MRNRCDSHQNRAGAAAIDTAAARPLHFMLYGMLPEAAAPLRERLDGWLRAMGRDAWQLDIRAVSHAPAQWLAEDIALLTRYTPAAEGLTLDRAAPGPGAAAPLHGFEHFWSGRRNAVAVGVEPYAVLVNKAKARAAGLSRYTLPDFAARRVRLRLPINLAPGTGDNGWIHPLFAEYTGWPHRPVTDVADLFLDPAALDGMNRLSETLLERCDASAVSSMEEVYAALLDSGRPGAVAAYGNPLVLGARLALHGRAMAEFEPVSLQRFMGLCAPSLFRVAALQLGSRVEHAQACEMARLLFDPLARDPLAPWLPQVAGLQSALLAALPHDFAFHARLPHLNVLADSGALAALALSLGAPHAAAGPAADRAGRVYRVAAAAYYDMAKHAHRERGPLSVARTAAPVFSLA